jgi:hypothetical protein
MNWAELADLDRSGVLDVQSHSLTHTWHFTSAEISDFYTPATARAYPWMAWNARPERKPFYLQEDQSTFVPWGTPIFEHQKSLIARRFIPDAEAIAAIENAVAGKGGPKFFSNPAWRDQLHTIVTDSARGSEFPGKAESNTEREDRIRMELGRSKTIIEEKLSKSVDFLCWPGGGVDPTVKRIAAEVGYRSWALPSSEKRSKRNRPGEDPSEVKRVPAVRDVRFLDRKWGVGSEQLVVLEMLAHQQSRFHDLARKFYKVGVAAGVLGSR